jgi:ubiquinone biosynthesis protein Coq4
METHERNPIDYVFIEVSIDNINQRFFVDMDRLYGTHKPTNLVQKSLLAIGSGIVSMADPSRDDMISIFGETTGTLALKYIQEKMLVDKEGEQILK